MSLIKNILLAFALLLAACQGEPDDIWQPEPQEEPLLHDLRVPMELEIAPTSLEVRGSFATTIGRGQDAEAEIPLLIEGGHLTLWSRDGTTLLVRDLHVVLADIEIPAGALGPRPITLTDVAVTLSSPAALVPSDDGARASVIDELDMEATWSLAIDGVVHPLQRLRLDRVPISLELERNALGALMARLVGFRDGTFWSWADMFELADLTVDLLARAPEATGGQ